MMSPEMLWKDSLNIRSQPPMTLMTTSTMAVQSVTAMSETQAMRRLRRYLRMRWSLYICSGLGWPGQLYSVARVLLYRLHERKKDHIANTFRTGEHHDQAVDAHSHAAGGGHAVF